MDRNEEQAQLDREIAKVKVEYEIDALNSQIKQHRQKSLEAQRTMNSAKNAIADLTARVIDAQMKLESI